MDINKYFKFLADICRYFKSLMDVIKYLILVEFGRNLRLIDLSRFFKFQFGVRVVYYRVFLFVIGGSK